MSVERDGLKPAAQLRGGHSDVVRCLDWDIEVPPPPFFFSLLSIIIGPSSSSSCHYGDGGDGDGDGDDDGVVDCIVSIGTHQPNPTHTHICTQSKSMATGGEDSKICLWSVPIAS